MKQIKVFVDCHVFDNGFQGTRTYLQEIYQQLIKDDTFKFYFAANNIENLESIFGKGSNIIYVEYKHYNKFLRLLFDIPAIIKKHQIDYAHFQYIVPPIKKCKYIVTTHDLLTIDFPAYFPRLFRLKTYLLYKHGMKKADIKLTVSQYSKQKIKEHFQYDNVYITPNAISDIFYENYNKTTLKEEVKQRFNINKYIIYISRWEPRKNHQLVLKAFIDLKLYPEYHLVFIGDQSIKNKEYSDMYKHLDDEIKNKIITMQKTDFKTMLTLLRGANASVYPSIAEGFGIPPLESLAAKIPTICSNATAMSDFDYMEDFLFDPNNQEQFNNKLKMILENDFSCHFEKLSCLTKEKYNWITSANILRTCILNKEKGEEI
jgi:glycosyltransferase involved in cell wall biosynthesis